MNRSLSRHLVHPLIFSLRGQDVLGILRQLQESEWKSAAEIRRLQEKKLGELLRYACESIPFYRRRFETAGIDAQAVGSIDDLPKLPYLEKADLAELADSVRKLDTRAKSVLVRRTAGSTGMPNVVLADRRADSFSLAARIRAQAWYGIDVGDRQLRFWGRPLAADRHRNRLKNWLLNRQLIDSNALGRDEAPETVKRIRRFRPDYAYGYSSMIHRYADLIEEIGTVASGMRLKACICTSETLMEHEKERIAAILNCPVAREYGCSEVDIISFECPDGGQHVMAENVLVEVDRSIEGPSGIGEFVVTDLNNRAMPLIRYRLGDLGSLSDSVCSCGRGLPLIGTVQGRKQGQYIATPGGDRIHSQTIAYVFEKLAAEGCSIRQFRIVQESIDHLSIFVVLPLLDTPERSRISDSIKSEVRSLLGDDMQVSISYSDNLIAASSDKKYTHFESRI